MYLLRLFNGLRSVLWPAWRRCPPPPPPSPTRRRHHRPRGPPAPRSPQARAQAQQADPHAAAGAVQAELSSLKAILGKYNVSEADMLGAPL